MTRMCVAKTDETVERETVLDAPPEEVWESLTDDDRLAEWLAEDAEIDAVEGGEVSVRESDGSERHGTVETVVEYERLIFTWARPGEAPSRVDFTIIPMPGIDGDGGGSRLRVVETVACAGMRLSALRRSLLLVAA